MPRTPSWHTNIASPKLREVRFPEPAFLLGEAKLDLAEHRWGVAERNHGVVARAFEPEIQFENAGSRGRAPPGGRKQGRGEYRSKRARNAPSAPHDVNSYY